MTRTRSPSLLTMTTLTLVLACASDSRETLLAPSTPLFAISNSEWSAPVHLDAPVNSTSIELGAELTPDGLSIYFASDRLGTLGDVDIWASRRACLECPWGTPVNLGPNINSAQSDGAPNFSPDGHVMFFSSNRTPGTRGGDDIWVSYREDTNDDLGWGPATNLGPEVNTTGPETGPNYNPALHAEGVSLYFVRGTFAAGATADIYKVLVSPLGEVLGRAEPVPELNSPQADAEPSIRGDGKEIVFFSTRPGGIGVGTADLWVATRQNAHVEWSTPTNLGAVINTAGPDLTPFLSRDGRTLLWSAGMAARPSLGRQDIWMSTRTPSGH
jgi:Tol biopolymer transport system component